MTEAFLHYVWQHQMFADGLVTTDGQPVVVLRAGKHNHDAGPDFFNVRVRIGDVEWAGNVEIHIHSSDWNAHRHSDDAAYNNIVLHVVYEHDAEVVLQNGKVPPTLELRHFLHPSLVANYESLMAPAEGDNIACSKRVGAVPQMVVNGCLERMAVERVEGKTEMVRRLLKESCGNWEQTCYWLMARYFGGKVNGLAFELLAKSLDQRILARWKDDRVRTEALLMGQAGLLDEYFEDAYPRALQADYEALRDALHLNPIQKHLWKFYRLRPSSFPTIRISQFADLVAHSSSLFSTLLDITDVKVMERLFDRCASEYWNDHYTFDSKVERNTVKRVGRMQVQTLLINAWVPLLFVYGCEHGQQGYKDQAMSLLSQLPPEDNAVVRRWAAIGVAPANAAESQALLQMTNSYCNNRRCLECGIGYRILKHK